MKKLKCLVYLTVIALSTLLSCTNESDDLITDNKEKEEKELKSIVYTDNYVRDNSQGVYIAPGIEWWYNREGTFYCYLYDVYHYDYPYSPYSPNNYFHYINIIWNGYPPYNYSNFQNYKIQVQYRIDNYDWAYPGTYANVNGLPYRTYGIYDILGHEAPLDLNSTDFAYGNLEFRIRMVHKDFPGPNIGTITEPRYNENLVSKWAYCSRIVTNSYGSGSPLLGDPNSGVDGRIKIYVNLPPESSTIDYSYFVSFGQHSYDRNFAMGGINGFYWKPAKTGTVYVTAQKSDYSPTPIYKKSVSKSATYDAGTASLTFSFSPNEF